MKDQECVNFLRQVLPRLSMRWPGFKKVRKQVCKRVQRRIHQLHLQDASDYLEYLESHPNEWSTLRQYCQITISRFNRDKHVFIILEQSVLPNLARMALHNKKNRLSCWSVGCASGEEPYTVMLLWHFKLQHYFPALQLYVLATDTNQHALHRAEHACYPSSSLKELHNTWKSNAFYFDGTQYCLHSRYRQKVTFLNQDIFDDLPEETFNLILCRNLVFTYFDSTLQKKTLNHLWDKLEDGGVLVIGAHETLPAENGLFIPIAKCIYKKLGRKRGRNDY